MRNIIKYIFIYIISMLFIGCDNPNSSCDYCYLNIEAPDLPIFTQLRAYIGYDYEYVKWVTDVTFEGCTWDFCEDIPVVNGSGYSSDDGYAYQMMGVMEENIGQIATIWVGYYDEYGNQWLDSIKVKINE